jgi:hypothetical protein
MVSLVITLIIIGVLLWLVTAYIPMDATIKKIIIVVVIICVVFYLLNAFGMLHHMHDVPVPQVR